MPATVQSQAIQNANTIMQLGAQLLQLSLAIQQVNNAWQDDASANTLNAMSTALLSADGTLGTADGAPNPAHPLDTRVYTTLQRAVSSNTLASMLTILNNVPTYVGGGAVSATGGVRAICNLATGG